ncbi:transglycosylase domain-containing protein [Amphibacillus cookii]|uniref:transglycosylase domain-containing protein n=1 Tax=Amphibacillus cookii TaxID=767787 RepID=UPI00195DDD98|nr:penicillin-binding protein 1A [Amphibacillus cookii]MBM7542544.1 penicillin-binding protein 1A [Amphibacillus cookii]
MAEQGQSRTARRQQQKQSKKNKSSIWKKIGLSLLAVTLAALIGAGAVFGYYIISAPDLDHDLLGAPASTRVYDVEGELFAELGQERRTTISYNDLPDILIDAVLATEDNRFFDHSGVDLRRSAAAILANFTRGFGAEGGSTITQQVVKSSLLSPDQTMERKVQEQWLALQVERAYEKEEILEMYLNKIYYGAQSYGVATAAETYFGITDLDDLTLAQAALLAGLPQRPSAYDPTVNPDLAQERMDTVLGLMVRHGKITEAEADEAASENVEDMLNLTESEGTPYHAFLDQVRIEIEEKLDVDMYNDGLEIHTTLDPDAQEHVEYVLSDQGPISFPDDELQSGLTVLDTQSGAIRAIGGGRNREVGGFNMAIQAKRQPGSAIKPILDYGPAIEYLNWSTHQQINNDAPYETQGGDIRNWNNEYQGYVSARYAMQQSLNVPAVKTLEEVGIAQATEFAEGIGLPIPEDGLNIRDGIGGSTLSMSSLDMAGAYSAFGNGGIYNEPYAVTEVVFSDGNKQTLKSDPVAAMSDATAYMVTDMLKTVVNSGTGTTANVSGLPMVGKTGSTNDYVDVWFAGYTTNYTVAVWSGYQDDATRAVTQTRISQEIFRHVMSEISVGMDTADFEMPNSVVRVDVERGSNPARLPSPYTPDSQIVSELFKRGHEPTEQSETFDRLDPVSGLSAQFNEEQNQIEVSWSDSNDQDVRFNIAYGTDGSTNNESSTSDTSFTIQSVERGTVYTIEVTAISDENSDLQSESRRVEIRIPDQEEEDEPDEPDEIDEPDQPEDPDEGNGDDQVDDPPVSDDEDEDQDLDQDSDQDSNNGNGEQDSNDENQN